MCACITRHAVCKIGVPIANDREVTESSITPSHVYQGQEFGRSEGYAQILHVRLPSRRGVINLLAAVMDIYILSKCDLLAVVCLACRIRCQTISPRLDFLACVLQRQHRFLEATSLHRPYAQRPSYPRRYAKLPSVVTCLSTRPPLFSRVTGDGLNPSTCEMIPQRRTEKSRNPHPHILLMSNNNVIRGSELNVYKDQEAIHRLTPSEYQLKADF